MNFIIRRLIQLGFLKKDLDYHLLRALMVISNRPPSPHMPFDFFGIVLKDNYVEMMEADHLNELVGENS